LVTEGAKSGGDDNRVRHLDPEKRGGRGTDGVVDAVQVKTLEKFVSLVTDKEVR